MRRCLSLALLLAACSPTPNAEPPRPVNSETAPGSHVAAPAANPETSRSKSDRRASTNGSPSAPVPIGAGTPCGELGCRLFDSAAQAFAWVLATKPAIVAVGEAHAQKGSEHIDSSAHRFTNTLLPLVSDAASDLVIELIVGDGGCEKATQEVAEATKPVTKTQRTSNKSEYLVLADTAEKLGVRPHVLRPNCDEFKLVANAGEDKLMQMLTLIAELSVDLVHRIRKRNHDTKAERDVVLLYGGAMHNDVSPRPGREPFSFGPRLIKLVDDRYVEIDMIVPEFIKDNESWRALEWYPHFEPAANPGKATLFNPRPGSYVLIFPRSDATELTK